MRDRAARRPRGLGPVAGARRLLVVLVDVEHRRLEALADPAGEQHRLGQVDGAPLGGGRDVVGPAITSGSFGSACRAHSGTAGTRVRARQTSVAYRSASRRSGAVTCAYGAATPPCSGQLRKRSVERRVAGAPHQLGGVVEERGAARIVAVHRADDPARAGARPATRCRAVPAAMRSAVDRLRGWAAAWSAAARPGRPA